MQQANDDFEIREWDLTSGKVLQKLSKHTAAVRALAVHPDGTILVSASDDKSIRFWSIANGEHQELLKLERHDFTVTSLSFSSDGKQILIGGDDGMIHLWDFSMPERRKAVDNNAALRFSLFGLDDWAVEQMTHDPAELLPSDYLELARCQWRLNHFGDAIDALSRARGEDFSNAYALICKDRLNAQLNGDAQHGDKK
jgi:hypothetical protein